MTAVLLTPIERDAIEILKDAQAELVVRGRTIGASVRLDGTVCALGAINVAKRRIGGSFSVAHRALNKVAEDLTGDHWGDYVPVNDIHNATWIDNDVLLTDEDDESVLQDFDIAVAYIEHGKLR